MTILMILSIIFIKSIGTYCPASNFISRGVRTGASNVATAVNVTDSARFALAINDITLDARPLGEEPIRIIPAAISAGNPNVLAMENPMPGMMVIQVAADGTFAFTTDVDEDERDVWSIGFDEGLAAAAGSPWNYYAQQ